MRLESSRPMFLCKKSLTTISSQETHLAGYHRELCTEPGKESGERDRTGSGDRWWKIYGERRETSFTEEVRARVIGLSGEVETDKFGCTLCGDQFSVYEHVHDEHKKPDSESVFAQYFSLPSDPGVVNCKYCNISWPGEATLMLEDLNMELGDLHMELGDLYMELEEECMQAIRAVSLLHVQEYFGRDGDESLYLELLRGLVQALAILCEWCSVQSSAKMSHVGPSSLKLEAAFTELLFRQIIKRSAN